MEAPPKPQSVDPEKRLRRASGEASSVVLSTALQKACGHGPPEGSAISAVMPWPIPEEKHQPSEDPLAGLSA